KELHGLATNNKSSGSLQAWHLKTAKAEKARKDPGSAQRDTLLSLLSVSPQSNATPAPSLAQSPPEEDREKFVQWISDYKLPEELVMPKNVDTYKGVGDPDSHVSTFEGTIKTCACNDPISCYMFQ
ncbi:hypothetical protein Tco_0539456, partial [Tanacetum coccineum]